MMAASAAILAVITVESKRSAAMIGKDNNNARLLDTKKLIGTVPSSLP